MLETFVGGGRYEETMIKASIPKIGSSSPQCVMQQQHASTMDDLECPLLMAHFQVHVLTKIGEHLA